MRSYRIVGLLGAAGFGKVYRATLQGPHGFQKEVAIKRLLSVPDANAAAEFERRLRDEARLSAQPLLRTSLHRPLPTAVRSSFRAFA